MSLLGSDFNFQFDINVCVDPAALCDSVWSRGSDLVTPKGAGEELKTQLGKQRPQEMMKGIRPVCDLKPREGTASERRAHRGAVRRGKLGGGACRVTCAQGELGLEGSMGSVGSSPTGAGVSEVSYLKTDGA